METSRRKAKLIKIGDIKIGGNNPIAIQSMAKTKTSDIKKTSAQIKELERFGCEIVRLAVRDVYDAKALKKIKQEAKVPLVADIHFDWRLALRAIDSGVDKIRLNPGNIYKREQIQEIAKAAKTNRIPIRVGVNSGSLESHNLTKSQRRLSLADKMVKNAVDYIRILEGFKFHDIVVSLKSSDIFSTIEACRRMAKLCDYPLHLGITATGPAGPGGVKSVIALSSLLLEGIGDTIRVSLTEAAVEEVRTAKAILETLGLRRFGPEIISCPTCGRCAVDLIRIVSDLERELATINYGLSTRPLKVAVMGCVVNGPGEARQADIGIAFGKKEGLLFKRGRPVRKIVSDRCRDVLLSEVVKLL